MSCYRLSACYKWHAKVQREQCSAKQSLGAGRRSRNFDDVVARGEQANGLSKSQWLDKQGDQPDGYRYVCRARMCSMKRERRIIDLVGVFTLQATARDD